MTNSPRSGRVISAAKRFLGLETKGVLADPPSWLELLFDGASPSIAGITITPLVAMTCAPVRGARCEAIVAETVGQLPVEIFQRNEDGSKAPAQDHPAYALLHDAANEWTASTTLIEEITRDALLQRQGGFAFINRVGGKPVELLRLDPLQTPVVVRWVAGEPTYEVTEKGDARIIDFHDIIHIPSPSISLFGLLYDARNAVALSLVMEEYACHLFSRGARPAGILKFKTKLDAASSMRMKASWNAAHGGRNSGGTAVIEEGGEFQPLTFSSVDAQFMDMRKFAIEEIARHFRVPPVFLMDYGRATWSNAEAMGNQFLTFTLMPWIKRWEGEIQLCSCFRPRNAKRSTQNSIPTHCYAPTSIRAWTDGKKPSLRGSSIPTRCAPLKTGRHMSAATNSRIPILRRRRYRSMPV